MAFYYQGRVIENIRISNTVDAYAVNGWESMKLENHSGIVDNYRYPKGDVEVMARYNQPLFLAVKMNRKVLNVGDTTIVDTYIVNEKNLKGNYSLQLIAKDAEGTVLATHVSSVHVKGGMYMVNVYRSAGILFLGQQAMFVLKQSWSKAKKLLQLETILCLL